MCPWRHELCAKSLRASDCDKGWLLFTKPAVAEPDTSAIRPPGNGRGSGLLLTVARVGRDGNFVVNRCRILPRADAMRKEGTDFTQLRFGQTATHDPVTLELSLIHARRGCADQTILTFRSNNCTGVCEPGKRNANGQRQRHPTRI